VRAFGGDDAAAVPGVPGLFRDRIAAVREDRGWAVVVEHHELMGLFSRHEQVRPGTAVSISWSARGRSWLHYVVDGRFVAVLDPQRPEQRDGDDPAVLDEHLAGLRLGAVPGNAAASSQLPASPAAMRLPLGYPQERVPLGSTART
jgi:hypothetical protein